MNERHATIVSTGCYVPERAVDNDELRKRFAESFPDFVDNMEEGTGITRRFWAPDGWATSDVALPAVTQALERAGRSPEDVDLIILGTDSPDYVTPSTSVVLQHKLGASRAGTFDVGCACASFPTGLSIAAGLIATNPWLKTVVVVGVYLMHRLASESDPLLFFYGDGAGAAVLEPSTAPGFVTSAFLADGSYQKYWGIYSGGTYEPASEESVREGRTTVRMLERYPPEINHEGWPRLVRQLCDRGGFSLDDIDMTVFTQVRKPSIEHVLEELGLPMERTHTVMERWGYTGSACVGMALDDAVQQRRIKRGDLVVFVGSGVGYNQAACAFRMD
jgi:3-oxoacyl-[acyl-carrier-protein] synthase-3